MQVSLTCWHCGKTQPIEVAAPPQFAFEVAGWANDVGMLGVLDMKRGRALVFCNDSCASAEKTSDGSFRARPKGVQPQAAVAA